ncbi:hypothetical protein Ahy_B03g063632 [Arachis hypogaea]|uniref:Uncharacterized protein n=1 Tax=Arachis hypogaea TaxID=3818 RepID=A0A444ZXQ2_ARAHY|nr:hypothetical protein Ahy_B03g063632 [Arachis hypogaea]
MKNVTEESLVPVSSSSSFPSFCVPPVCACRSCFALFLRALPLPLSVRCRSCLAARALPPVSGLRHPPLPPPISHLRPPPSSSIALPGTSLQTTAPPPASVRLRRSALANLRHHPFTRLFVPPLLFMSGSKKNKKHLSIKVQKSGNREVISAYKTKLSHPKPIKSRAPVPSHVSKKPSALPPSSSQPLQKFKKNLLSSHADHTPSPSTSPAESPYCSPIQPQSFDNAPNNERNLHHAHPSDENHHDESLAQEGELVTQEGLLKIEPFGNEFNPCTAVRHVTNTIKSKFSEFCASWGHASEIMRDLWFTEFKKNCMWEPQHNARIHSKFKNWSAAKTVNRASNAGSSMHTSGSISMGEHARRMEKATGVKPSLEEVYTKCHTKKDKNLSSKLDSRNCSETSKDNLNIEQELYMWKEKAKEQEMINEEQKVKLKDVEHKLKDQGRQLNVQQKRIGFTEKTIHALYKKLNLPLPSTLSDPTEDELGTGSSDDNMSD